MELMKNGIIKNWSSVFGHRPEGYDIEVANFDNRGALEVLKSEVSNLPNDKPYTLAAQQYANILMDKLIYGDTYVVAHHLASLQSLAQLCEPLYKETVVLSRNMLAGLGYETYYDDAQCTQSVEPRSIQNKSDRNVSLMPNPTNGKLTIEYAGDIARIDIMNLQGVKIKQVEGNTHSFDISELQSGVYFVTIQTVESGTRVKKVIKIQ